jgi:hypothetical protein
MKIRDFSVFGEIFPFLDKNIKKWKILSYDIEE